MKFGKRLEEDLLEPGWVEHYVQYKVHKKVIKVLSLLGEGADDSLLGEALTMVPRRGRLLRRLSRDAAEGPAASCPACKRWRVFFATVEDDARHVQDFFRSTVQALATTFHTSVAPGVHDLLLERKNERLLRDQEPTLYPGSHMLETLAKFALFVDTVGALRGFVAVNNQALQKITKKFRKRVLAPIQAEPCGENCAHNLIRQDDDFAMGHEESRLKEFDDFDSSDDEDQHDQGGYGRNSLPDPVEDALAATGPEAENRFLSRGLDRSCKEEWETLRKLEAAATILESKIMMECSTFHDFVSDHKTQLIAQRQQDKLRRVEARQRMITRLTQHIDLDNHARPAAMLLAGVTLPLLTLMVTYYISLGIYVDEARETTVFDEKGWFISASIDRAPASNIGTLGLTTTLSMLSIIIFVKHKIVKKQLRGRIWMRTHRIATAFGLLSTFCGNGVAAFQHQFHAKAHNTFAATFFVFGMIHVVLETAIDVHHSLSMPFTRRVRLGVATMLILSVAGFLVPMGYVIAFPELDKEWMVFWKKVAASFEVAAFGCFVIWFASYYSVLKASQFKLHVQYRVRLDSSEDLTSLRFSRHHHRRSNSYDSLDEQVTGSSTSIGSDSPTPPGYSHDSRALSDASIGLCLEELDGPPPPSVSTKKNQ